MNSLLFTDLYQLTMAASYFESGKFNETAVFELFFRDCPFDGEYAVCAGHNNLRELLEKARFSKDDIRYLRELNQFASAPEAFFEALESFDLNDVQINGVTEGELVFARTPLFQFRGPLWKLQILESGALNATNFATLCATYARRIRRVAPDHLLTEFGLRRAQGPDGALTATRSAFLGGFDSTSFVEAGKRFEIPVVGTMAHSFVQSFTELTPACFEWGSSSVEQEIRSLMKEDELETNEGELASFLSYAKSFPDASLLLVDTYDCLRSGIPNAIRVFKFLKARGHKPLGIRLDSGDLAYLSIRAREMLDAAGLEGVQIFASNDLNEKIIASLISQGAQITGWGVGTQLVTCAEQPALGGVYKLVELEGQGRIKLSEQTQKTTLPCSKTSYRLYGQDDKALLDLLCVDDEPEPVAGQSIQVHHPYDAYKKANVTPQRVRKLLKPLFKKAQWLETNPLAAQRTRSLEQMSEIREDILRRENPTPYKVSLTQKLKQEFDDLIKREAPPAELS